MPRVYVRKTTRAHINLSSYKNAYDEVKAGSSLRNAAKRHGLNYSSLSRYIRKRDTSADGENLLMGYTAHNRVFNDEQEREFLEYLVSRIDIHFGLTKNEVRKLAYEFTVLHNLSRPRPWDDNKMAGEEWLRMFMERNPELSIPKRHSKASCNKNNGNTIYDNLNTIMERHKFEPQDIYSVMETGISTLENSDRVVKRDACQASFINSEEKDYFISVAFTANVIGNVIPPFFVFPQVCYQDHFIRDGPIGSAGTANTSGWMQDESIMNYLKHFKKYTRASPSNKVLLILESQYLDINNKTLDFCKGNGIVLLSFPQHCSHKHQPLYQTTFGSLKEAVNTSCDVWMLNHPGKKISIYNIPRIVASATLIALTPLKIQAGFRKTGFYPYDPHMFTEFDFASVTDTNNKNKTEEEITLKINVQPDDKKSPQSPLNSLLIVKTEREESFDDEP